MNIENKHVKSNNGYQDKVKGLDLESKIKLLSGKSAFTLHGNESIGLQSMVLSDGPTGVRGLKALHGDKVALLPNATLIASSWDDDIAREVGIILSQEALRQGVNVVLGPTINLHRTPLGGRLFEAYSEDPYLTGRIASNYVLGMQGNGTGACLKHLVANESETMRNFVNSVVSDAALRELYLLPFEMVVEDADPWSMMSGYNNINGEPASSQYDIKMNIVKGEWEWNGLIMSDWYATKSTVESVNNGLDLVMPGPGGPWNARLVTAVHQGEVDESIIDEHVGRLLHLADRVGALDRSAGNVEHTDLQAPDSVERRHQLRRIASRGMTLLVNDGALPLGSDKVSLIGRHAMETICMGGGSAKVNPPHQISLSEALKEQLGENLAVVDGVNVRERPLCVEKDHITDPVTAQQGMRVTFLDKSDRVIDSWVESNGSITLEREDGVKEFPDKIVFEAKLSDHFDEWQIGGIGAGSWEVSVGEHYFSESLSFGSFDPGESVIRPASTSRSFGNISGQVVSATIRLNVIDWRRELENKLDIDLPEESHMFEMTSQGVFSLVATPIIQSDDEAIAIAESVAQETDISIVVVGLTEETETEGADKATLSLPGRQDELVSRVAGVAKKTIVVVNAATPILMPWVNDVDAILIAGLPGQEGGHAIADVLTGKSEPTGRLVTSYPAADGESPAWEVKPDKHLDLTYDENLHVGYRGYEKNLVAAPLFWFGDGIGYGVWHYENLQILSRASGDDYLISVNLANVGDRDSRETVQVYFKPADDDMPIRLVGFRGVEVAAGKNVRVAIECDKRMLRRWNESDNCWKMMKDGEFVIARGLGDIRLRKELI